MNKRNVTKIDKKIAVDVIELQNMLSVGKAMADKIGTDAGAVIRVGRRKLYNVEKIQDYMNELSEVSNG